MYKNLLIPALIFASLSSMAVAQDRAGDDKARGDAAQHGNATAPNQYRPDDFPGSNNKVKPAQGSATGASNANGTEYRPDDYPGSNNRNNATRGNTTSDNGKRAEEYRPDDYPGSNNRGPDYRPGRPQFKKDRGAGPQHDLRKGSHVPDEYRTQQYVIQDWRGHHLSKPKRGYQWVQAGDDYLLVSVSTGTISKVLLGQ